VIILFIYALASSCATLHSILKSCDPVNKALEVSCIGGYIPIVPTDFVYIDMDMSNGRGVFTVGCKI
jgi:hypothetical protein